MSAHASTLSMLPIEMEILVTATPRTPLEAVLTALQERGIRAAVVEDRVRAYIEVSSIAEFAKQSDLIYRAPGVTGLEYPLVTQERYATLDRAIRRSRTS